MASTTEPAREPVTLALPFRLRVDRGSADRVFIGRLGEDQEGVELREVSLQVSADETAWTLASVDGNDPDRPREARRQRRVAGALRARPEGRAGRGAQGQRLSRHGNGGGHPGEDRCVARCARGRPRRQGEREGGTVRRGAAAPACGEALGPGPFRLRRGAPDEPCDRRGPRATRRRDPRGDRAGHECRPRAARQATVADHAGDRAPRDHERSCRGDQPGVGDRRRRPRARAGRVVRRQARCALRRAGWRPPRLAHVAPGHQARGRDRGRGDEPGAVIHRGAHGSAFRDPWQRPHRGRAAHRRACQSRARERPRRSERNAGARRRARVPGRRAHRAARSRGVRQGAGGRAECHVRREGQPRAATGGRGAGGGCEEPLRGTRRVGSRGLRGYRFAYHANAGRRLSRPVAPGGQRFPGARWRHAGGEVRLSRSRPHRPRVRPGAGRARRSRRPGRRGVHGAVGPRRPRRHGSRAARCNAPRRGDGPHRAGVGRRGRRQRPARDARPGAKWREGGDGRARHDDDQGNARGARDPSRGRASREACGAGPARWRRAARSAPARVARAPGVAGDVGPGRLRAGEAGRAGRWARTAWSWGTPPSPGSRVRFASP